MTPAQHLTIYRLAQESLTNAFKHGDRTKGVRLAFVWQSESVELRVRSSLRTGDAHQSKSGSLPLGRGLAGMKARAAAAGGWVETIDGEGTFEVLAFLPAAEKAEPRILDEQVSDGRPMEGVVG